MIRSDSVRRVLLVLTGLVYAVIAVRALIAPDAVASRLGYVLAAPNGYSEFHAVYVGVWLATAALAVLAAVRIRQALLGDVLALFVLAQPAGRVLALARFGAPEGVLLFMFALELAGGLALLAARPLHVTNNHD